LTFTGDLAAAAFFPVKTNLTAGLVYAAGHQQDMTQDDRTLVTVSYASLARVTLINGALILAQLMVRFVAQV
jgi:hypothetical protein